MADYRTETQKISDALRDAIIRGEFRSGERLPQRKIAEKYDSTTIVVREALRLLENEHLVSIEPRFGAMVREITPKILKERYIVREALEGMAARLAALNMTDLYKKRLYAIAEECDKNLMSDAIDYREKAQLHQQFHDILLDMTECEELNRLLRNIYLNTIILSNAYHVDWSKDVPRTHTRLVDVLVQGDPDKAEQAMRQHVRNGMDMELESLMRMREN
jgi:DNA-binding GntR family transcriptional regulator